MSADRVYVLASDARLEKDGGMSLEGQTLHSCYLRRILPALRRNPDVPVHLWAMSGVKTASYVSENWDHAPIDSTPEGMWSAVLVRFNNQNFEPVTVPWRRLPVGSPVRQALAAWLEGEVELTAQAFKVCVNYVSAHAGVNLISDDGTVLNPRHYRDTLDLFAETLQLVGLPVPV
jgi:hypothetical protein